MKCPPHPSLALLVAFSFFQVHAFAQPAKVSIIEPEAGQQVAGTVTVKVAVGEGTPVPVSMYVGLGKLNWQEMKRIESTGRWVGTIDSTLVPNGQLSCCRRISNTRPVLALAILTLPHYSILAIGSSTCRLA